MKPGTTFLPRTNCITCLPLSAEHPRVACGRTYRHGGVTGPQDAFFRVGHRSACARTHPPPYRRAATTPPRPSPASQAATWRRAACNESELRAARSGGCVLGRSCSARRQLGQSIHDCDTLPLPKRRGNWAGHDEKLVSEQAAFVCCVAWRGGGGGGGCAPLQTCFMETYFRHSKPVGNSSRKRVDHVAPPVPVSRYLPIVDEEEQTLLLGSGTFGTVLKGQVRIGRQKKNWGAS